MFNLFSFFKKKKKKIDNNLRDQNNQIIQESAIKYSKTHERFLKLKDNQCAIVLHPNDNVQVIFTRLYDNQKQQISDNQEALMALALFIKQPGFLEMIKSEFRKIAAQKISTLTENSGDNK